MNKHHSVCDTSGEWWIRWIALFRSFWFIGSVRGADE